MSFLKKTIQLKELPTIQAASIVAILAVLLTAIEIYFSGQLGLLANAPSYDGVDYMTTAKTLFYRFGHASSQPPYPLTDLVGSRFPLWSALMLLSFLLFGEGEWQCYTIRFYPTFLFLLLMVWVLRRRGNAFVAWIGVAVTALLPIICVSLRATNTDYFTNRFNQISYGNIGANSEWYLADLRPNFLFAVLMLWAIALIIERIHNLNRNTLLAAGAFAGLALLSKTSFLPILLFTAGLTVLFALTVNYKRLRSTFLTCLWAIPPFIGLMLPWLLTGGLGQTLAYIHLRTVTEKGIWADSHATFVSEFSYFWKLFSITMGTEGWLFLGLGLVSSGIVWIKLKRIDRYLMGYLGLAVAFYILISANPIKDQFTGQLYFLLLWLFSWIALVPGLTWVSHKSYRWLLLAVVSLYVVGMLTGSAYALSQWNPNYKQAGIQNHTTIQQIAKDLDSLLTPSDCFVPADVVYVTNIHYYMQVDGMGNRPRALYWDQTQPKETVSPFIHKEVSQCKAILAYVEDLTATAKYLPVYPGILPFFRGVKDWLKQPDSEYRLFREYPLLFDAYQSGSRRRQAFTIQLYAKQPE